MRPERLRIESHHGSPVNDYRIRKGHVEVRLLDASGHPCPSPLSYWRVLDESEVELHFALETVVAKWLEARLSEEDSNVVTLRTHHTGDRVPNSGTYRVYHKAHRLPDEVALLAGFPFPRCSKCPDRVTFRAVTITEGLAQRHSIVLHELPEMESDDVAARGAA